MKARAVRKLDPDGTLADNAERIVRVRLDELYSFMPAAADPAEVEALHDLRIAAKRLRYVLELTASCFGSYARQGTRTAKDVQDVVGEIHDCDVMLPRVLEHLERLRAADAATLRERGAGVAGDLPAELVRAAPHRSGYRGLVTLATYLQARRGHLFDQFLDLWGRLEQRDFRARLDAAISERPADTLDGDGLQVRGGTSSTP